MTKHASENCGVGTTLSLWKFQPNTKCPQCSCLEETTEHVQKCNGHGASAIFEESLEGIKNYLHDQQTHPELQRAIMYSFWQWRKGRLIDFLQFSAPVRRAVVEQSHIGWLDMLEGAPSKQWQRVQAAHYQDLGMRKSSLKWMRGLLTRLQKLAWKQWDHRNQVKHEDLQPHDAHAIGRLNREVMRILQEIPSLPAED